MVTMVVESGEIACLKGKFFEDLLDPIASQLFSRKPLGPSFEECPGA